MSTIERDELETYATLFAKDSTGVHSSADVVLKSDARRIVADLKAKLAEVTRERDEARKYLADMDQASIKSSKDLAQAREQLSAVQAEAAAMRKLIDDAYRLTTDYPRPNDDNGYELSNRVTVACKKIANTTAGRELADEMRRDKERIKELEAELADTKAAIDHQGTLLESQGEKITAHQDVVQKKDRVIESLLSHPLSSPRNIAATAELIKAMADQLNRFERKCLTAKAALVEHYRGKIDPAWFGDQPTPDPVWQYRRWNNETPGYGVAIWRTSNGSAIESSFIGQEKRYWSTSSGFSSWRECVDNPNTFPCNESGERIEEPSFGQQIVDSLQAFSDKLASGEEIRGTRVTIKDGEVTREKDVVVIPARKAAEMLAKPGVVESLAESLSQEAEAWPMQEQADEPLKVGDWVELVDPARLGLCPQTTIALNKLTWPRKVVCSSDSDLKIDGLDIMCDRSRFRRVPAPSADAPLVAIARELRELLREHQGGYVIHMIHELHQLLIKLRDAEGGDA